MSLNSNSIPVTNGPPVLKVISTALMVLTIPSFKKLVGVNSKGPALKAGLLNCETAENSPF